MSKPKFKKYNLACLKHNVKLKLKLQKSFQYAGGE